MNPSPSDNSVAAATSLVDPEANHFERLGVPERFDLDREMLEGNYLERSRLVHPDRFASASPGEQRLAMERAAALNEAYRALRDPVRRAEYLVHLGGTDLDAHGAAPEMEQAFLMEMIERRERLEAERGDLDALESFLDEVLDECDQVLDGAVAAIGSGNVKDAARRLVARRYLQRLADEIESARDEG